MVSQVREPLSCTVSVCKGWGQGSRVRVPSRFMQGLGEDAFGEGT